jgi:translation initiation factor IF-3
MLFNVRKYKPEDIKTMCMLVKEPFPIYNEFIELHKEIQLIDENKKLIGIYSAAEARKKASSLKQDIILLNENSTPAVCKACNFRETILKKFYEEIVKKRN